MSEGLVNMDGKLALAYSRIRKVGNNDFERTERQRRVMFAAFQKAKFLGIPKIIDLVNYLFPSMDLTNSELISLAYHIYRIGPDTMETYRIPVDNSYQSAWIRGMLVLIPDLTRNREVLREIVFAGGVEDGQEN